MLFYRLITTLLCALLRARQLVRSRPGSTPEVTAERLSPPRPRPGDAPALWIHGASNGELTAARGLIADLVARYPAADLILTTNTETARAMVLGWALPRTTVRIAPFDQRALVRAFFDRLRPAALILIENEIWPNRLLECARRDIPVLVIGARLSEKSARHWGHLPGLTRRLLAAIRYLSAQDAASEARFRALGLDPSRIGPPVNLKSGNLKSGNLRPTDPLPATAATTAAAPEADPPPFARTLTLLAASTHEGEEEQVLDAYQSARKTLPGLRLILAPRHPRRRDAIEAAIAARALPFATRSRGQTADADTAVYLADTMGEMDLWYRAAGLCFVGGSLTDRGGHTPFEPAACGAALLHGPHTANFAAAYAALDRSRSAVLVTDPASLARALILLGGDAEAQTALSRGATAALAALDDTAAGLAAFQAALAATFQPSDAGTGHESATF